LKQAYNEYLKTREAYEGKDETLIEEGLELQQVLDTSQTTHLTDEPENAIEAEALIAELNRALTDPSLAKEEKVAILHRLADLHLRFKGELEESLKFLKFAAKTGGSGYTWIPQQIQLTEQLINLDKQRGHYAKQRTEYRIKIQSTPWSRFWTKIKYFFKATNAGLLHEEADNAYKQNYAYLKNVSFELYTKTLHKEKEPVEITLASFNIRYFSDGSRDDTELLKIAEVIKDYDLIAIQEARDERVLQRLVQVMQQAGRDFEFIVSAPAGRGQKELYAFLYDRKMIEVQAVGTLAEDPFDEYAREPFYARFRANNFDFLLLNIHVVYGSSIGERRLEVSHLASLFGQIQNQFADEKDLILLGDFNLEPVDKGWDGFKAIPGMDFLIRPPKKTMIYDTWLYDNFWFSKPDVKEYLGKCGVNDFDIWIFDNDDAAASLAVSDHRPVWAKFNTALPDDD
ncbi:endonuclease/exonuclease/phosphatase family protein, partial [Candidatus Riflebacteria bacterium]